MYQVLNNTKSSEITAQKFGGVADFDLTHTHTHTHLPGVYTYITHTRIV